jgi:hypothetical protein
MSKLSAFKFEKSSNFEFKKLPNFEPVPKSRSHKPENCRILNQYQKVDPTVGKITSHGAFRTVIRKTTFLKTAKRKQLLLI